MALQLWFWFRRGQNLFVWHAWWWTQSWKEEPAPGEAVPPTLPFPIVPGVAPWAHRSCSSRSKWGGSNWWAVLQWDWVPFLLTPCCFSIKSFWMSEDLQGIVPNGLWFLVEFGCLVWLGGDFFPNLWKFSIWKYCCPKLRQKIKTATILVVITAVWLLPF